MIQEKAQHKARVLQFWADHGIKAAMAHDRKGRSTLYRWKKHLAEGKGKLESLNDRRTNKTPKRQRMIDPRITEYIITTRTDHPRYGKEKLAADLEEECRTWNIKAPSVSTVGRVIADLKKAGRLPDAVAYSLYGKTGTLVEKKPRKRAKKLRRNGYEPKEAGDFVELDTVIYFINGIRRYIITAVDLTSRFSFALAYTTASSASATDFLKKLESVAPFVIKRLQTDNGSEFEKHFRDYLASKDKDERIIHFHTYPRHPKQNAHIERFNRTIQEEFANWHRLALAYDLAVFNQRLIDWLLWYNTKRRHHAIGLVSPLRYIVSNLVAESHLGWTRTAY
jgi:transposase InsO family protein